MSTTFTPNAIYRNKWDLVPVAATGTEKSGDVRVMEDGRIGIYQGLSSASGMALYKISGQFDFPAATATVFAAGAQAFWNSTSNTITNSNTGNAAGRVSYAKTNAQSTVRVNINLTAFTG